MDFQREIICVAMWVFVAPGCGGTKIKPSRHANQLVQKAAAWLRAGDLHRAEAGFSLALEYRPAMAEAVNGLALVATARGENRRAERLFRKALALNEDLSEAHNNLAVLLCRRGRLKSCRSHLVQALAIDPGYAAARYNLGRCLIRMGLYNGARRHLLKVVAQHPRTARAWAQLALVSIKMNRLAAAGRAVHQALRHNRNLAAAHRAAGRLMAARGAHADAERAYRNALRLDPSDWQARHYLAVSLMVQGKISEARRHLKRVAARKPRNGAVLFATAFAFYLDKNYIGAISRLRTALRWNPGLQQALYLLALCLHRTGRHRQAARLLKKVVRARTGQPLIKMARRRLRHFQGL